MAISAVADKWPATRAVFDKYGLPWHDSPVAYWEPITQAAAAHGWTPTQQQQLLAELQAVIAQE